MNNGTVISITELLQSIHDEDYLILRNFEGIDNTSFASDHPDIDILCADRERLCKKINAIPRLKKDDGIHYKILLGDYDIPVDIRTPGDGYLCEKWECALLAGKIKNIQGFNIPDDVNYFYSLLYHVLIQKSSVSEEYKKKLEYLASKIRIDFSMSNSLKILEQFMEANKYYYTYSNYLSATHNFESVNRALIDNSNKKALKRYLLYIGKKAVSNIRRMLNG
jgi:hypothetical protein